MSYLLSNLALSLLATFLLGLFIGWFFWGRLKNRLALLETEWRQRYLNLDGEYQSVIKDFNDVELALKDKTAHNSIINDEKNELTEKFEAIKSIAQQADQETEDLKSKLRKTTASYHVASKKLDERTQQLETFRTAPNEISELKSLLGKATQRYNNNGLELKNKHEELTALQNKCDETNKRSISLNKELAQLQAQLLKRDKEFEFQTVAYASLQNELNNKTEMLNIVQQELDARNSITEDRAQLLERDNKIINLQQALENKRKRIADLESQAKLNKSKDQTSALENELTVLRDRIPALEHSLKQRDSSIAALENEVSRLANDFPPLRDELDERNSQVQDLKQQVNTLQQKIPAFRSTISARDAHIRELEIFIKEAQKAILKPANVIAHNGNGNSNSNGSGRNGHTVENGNVIQLNGNAKKNSNGSLHKQTLKVNNGTAALNVKTNANGTTSTSEVHSNATKKPQKRKLRPYGLKKPTRKPDDLKLISGIGETLEKTLHKCGIYYFEQIASFNLKDVNTVDKLLNFRGRIDRDDWIKQARMLIRSKASGESSKKNSQARKPQCATASSRRPRMKSLGMKRPTGELDDLKLINGVGPTLERKLHRLGIYHFEQIAQLSAEDIELIDSKLKTYKGRVKRDKWPLQARRLHKELHVNA